MDLNGRTVAILGLGESGVAAAALSLSKGGKTYVSDLRADTATRNRAADLRRVGVDVDVGGHDVERMAAADVVVVSPGIPPDVPVLATLRARGVHWVSEPEFAFRFLRAPLVAVTGTNGKTTTAALAAHLVEASGATVGLGGNIGGAYGPAASLLALQDPVPDWFVLEMSSFQLADIDTFAPAVGVVTNLAPDHLDRYASIEAYYGDKQRIFTNATDDSRWVLSSQPEVLELAEGVAGETFVFDIEAQPGRAAYLDGDRLTLDVHGPESLIDRQSMKLLGRHNVENALAAALVARLAGADPESISAGLESFGALPHRLEPVADAGGVLWVNDSKATNVAATSSAIQSLDRPMVLLLGGVDKGESFVPLREVVQGRVRTAVVYGEVADRIRHELADTVPVVRGGYDFDSVVGSAASLAESGDAIVLSPATSSFDMFRNYEDRGDRFRAIAQDIARRTR